MAEGKRIEVKVVATGGQQAAAEIGKLPTAINAAAAAAPKLASAQNNLTTSTNSSRFAMQNAAFQLQDMAVQLEMGTSATRVFSQQVPQLLGSFGAVGAIAGAVIGVGVPLAAALFRSGKEAADAAPKVDDLNDALETHKDYIADVAAAKSSAENDDWIASLDEEEQYYDKLNSRIERQIVLTAKLRALKEQTTNAEQEALIAEIETDPNRTEEQKITDVADIRQEQARAAAEAQKQKLADKAAQDAAAADAAQAAAVRQAADELIARKARQDAEAAAADLDARRVAGEQAGRKIPSIEGRISSAERNARAFVNPETGETLPGGAEAQSEVTRLKEELAAARKAVADLQKVKAEQDEVKRNLENKRAAETKQKQEAEAARLASENAFGESQVSDAEAREGAQQIDARFQAESRARAAREADALRRAAERRKQEDDRKTQEEAERRTRAEAGVGRDAKGLLGEAGKLFPAGLPEKFQRDTEAIIAGLEDGDQGGEAQKLADAMARLAQAVQGRSAATDIRLQQLDAAIALLNQKVKNK